MQLALASANKSALPTRVVCIVLLLDTFFNKYYWITQYIIVMFTNLLFHDESNSKTSYVWNLFRSHLSLSLLMRPELSVLGIVILESVLKLMCTDLTKWKGFFRRYRITDVGRPQYANPDRPWRHESQSLLKANDLPITYCSIQGVTPFDLSKRFEAWMSRHARGVIGKTSKRRKTSEWVRIHPKTGIWECVHEDEVHSHAYMRFCSNSEHQRSVEHSQRRREISVK